MRGCDYRISPHARRAIGSSFMRLVFFGLPLAALALHRAGHEVVLAGICRQLAPGTRRLQRILGAERVLVVPRADAPALLRRVESLRPELIVSWFWPRRLPMRLVRAALHGGFGVHPSLLPRWRGADPCFRALDAGDVVTGVTAHEIEAEYDTGALLGHRRLIIESRWDSWQLARALDRPSLALMLDTVDAFARGVPPAGETQDDAVATDAPAPTEDELEIDWHRDAAAIVRRVRAAAPYPGAWTFVGEEALVVTLAEVAHAPSALLPGEGTVVDGRAVVAAGQGGVALLRGRWIEDDGERTVNSLEIAELLERSIGDRPFP